MMRQVWVAFPGPPEVLISKPCEPQPLRPGDVRIQAHSIGVNFADVLVRLGRYPEAPPTPCVPGFELSGTVLESGSDVSQFRPGDRVLALCRFGGYASEIVADQKMVFALPDSVDFATATAFPVNYLTALLLVEKTAALQRGERAVIHSAAGGVGLALIDICRQKGAEIYAVASKEKHGFLKERGAFACFDSRDASLFSQLEQVLGARKADAVFDSRGGDSWKQGLKLLAPFGRLAIFGFSDLVQSDGGSVSTHSKKIGQAGWFGFDAYDLVAQGKSVGGFNLATLWHDPEFIGILQPLMARLFDAHRRGELRPWIGAQFPLEQADKAHAFLQSRKSVGKITLIP